MTSTEDCLLEHHRLECSSACSLVCLSPSCHHARLPVRGRCLEWRRGRRRGRCRCLEIVVDGMMGTSARSLRHLDWNRHVAPPASIEPIHQTCWWCPWRGPAQPQVRPSGRKDELEVALALVTVAVTRWRYANVPSRHDPLLVTFSVTVLVWRLPRTWNDLVWTVNSLLTCCKNRYRSAYILVLLTVVSALFSLFSNGIGADDAVEMMTFHENMSAHAENPEKAPNTRLSMPAA